MALLRSLRNLARKTTFKTPNPKPYVINTTKTIPILTSRASSLHGPLYPPWKLLQSATPFYFRSDVVSIRHVHFLRDDDKLGLNKDGTKGNGVTRGGGGVVGSWVNWPNFISVSRLVSGPVLG